MFRSTTIFRELQCPCQSHCYLTTFVCMLSVVVWQHIILFGSDCASGASRVCVFLLVLWTAQTDPNNMICCHTTTLSIHTTVVK